MIVMLVVFGIAVLLIGLPMVLVTWDDSRREYRQMIEDIREAVKKPIHSLLFEDFKSSYNLNPSRWVKFSDAVCYRVNPNNKEEDEYFYFKTASEHEKYKKWLEDHCSAKEQLMFNMIADLQAITPADSEHAEAIRDAISAINSKYPNLETKYGDDTSND